MELKEAILSRRSVKIYNQVPVDKKEVLDLLNLAVNAPNHKTRQTWRFVYLDATAKSKLFAELDKLFAGLPPEQADLEYRKRLIGGANALLIVINQFNPADPLFTHEEICASAALIENFYLLATEKKLGVCWKTKLSHPILSKYFGVQPNEMVTGILTLGHYDVLPPGVTRIKADQKFTSL